METATMNVRIDERKREIINGKIVMMAPPIYNHGSVTHNVHLIFDKYLKGKTCVVIRELGVRLDKDNVFTPDVFVVCNRSIIKPNFTEGAPNIVVEVLSPSTARYDRTEKLAVYEKYGVREYWLVDIPNRSVEIHSENDNGKFGKNNTFHLYDEWEMEFMTEPEKTDAQAQGAFFSSVFPDLEIRLEDIFANLMDWN